MDWVSRPASIGRRWLQVEFLRNEPRSISHVWDGGRQRRSEQPLRMRVRGGAACVEGCCVCGMPRTGMGVESPAGMREMGRLTLIDIPRWYDVGDVHGHGALAKLAIVARAPVDEAWVGCPAMYVSTGGVGGFRLSDVGVLCRTSRRRQGWFRLKNSRR